MNALVIGLGQAAAGDDGVGPAVLEELRRRGVPAGMRLVEAGSPASLWSLLETTRPVVIVDAAVGGTPGDVLDLAPEQLAGAGVRPVSSHGIGVAETIALARLLMPERISPAIRIVAVAVAPPRRSQAGLSSRVEAAVEIAAEAVLRLAAHSESVLSVDCSLPRSKPF